MSLKQEFLPVQNVVFDGERIRLFLIKYINIENYINETKQFFIVKYN